MKEHKLKTWPEFFKSVADGSKKAEIRRDDRGFSVGDILILKEYEPREDSYISGSGTALSLKTVPPHYTGASIAVRVTHIFKGGMFGIKDGYSMMSFEIVPDHIGSV